jgi:hypothetical protein
MPGGGFYPAVEVRELGERHGREIHGDGLVHDLPRAPVLTAHHDADYGA